MNRETTSHRFARHPAHDWQDERRRLQQLRTILERRQKLQSVIRDFFSTQGFLHVETPTRVPAPAQEEYIDAIPCANGYLRTSPELHMKRMLAAGYSKIYQIGPCFRQGEQGTQHHPEFTMLEWYRAGATYDDILTDTMALVRTAALDVLGEPVCHFKGHAVRLDLPWTIAQLDDIFPAMTGGCSVDTAVRDGSFETQLCEQVEPNLGIHTPTVLRDYPMAYSGLARRKCGKPHRAERWELYIGGLELANAYSELSDPAEQRSRFARAADIRQSEGRTVYPEDPLFLAALDASMPESAGIALGLDRLLMVLTGTERIDAVVAFAENGRTSD